VRFVPAAEPGADRPHRPRGAAAHEEWTLLATDDRGEIALAVRFHYGIPFRRAAAGAGEPDGVFSLGLFRGGRPVARCLDRYPAAAVSAEGPLLKLRIGENTLTGGRDHNLTIFELGLDESPPGSPRRIRGNLLFQLPNHERDEPVPAARVPGPAAGRDEEVWTLLAPDAIVRGEISVLGRRGAASARLAFSGRGSIDHAAGVTDLRHSIRFAIRSSVHSGEFSAFAWHAAPSGSAERSTLIVLAERDRPLIVLRDAVRIPDGRERPAGARPRSVDWSATGEEATVRLRHALEPIFERGPHFLRCRPEISVEARTPAGERKAFSARGVAELIVPPSRVGSAVRATRLRNVRSRAGIDPSDPGA